MTKQIINVGSGEQVGDGESIRVAFIKTNENFTELYDNFASISSDVSTLSDVASSGSYTDLLNTPTLSDVAFSGSYTDLLNTPIVVGASDRLVNGSKELVLSANGTLTVPSPTSNQFPTIFSAANYVPTLGKPTLTLTGAPWALNGQYVYAQNGETQLFLDDMWPTLNNPGYTSGDTFAFDSTVHGIADFVLTIQLNDVVQAGPAGWTASVAASQPPVYASTIKSLGAVKLTANNSSWIFGTNGILTLPFGGDIVDSAGTSVLGGTGAPITNISNGTSIVEIPNPDDNVSIVVGGVSTYTFSNTGRFRLPDTSIILQNNTQTTTLRTDIPNGTSAIIHTAPDTFTGYKLVITVEGRLDGDVTFTQHTQTCEATIAAIYNSSVEPVMSVYGIVYTSPTPLATFTVRRGLNNSIDVVALNSQTLETLHVSVHTVKFVSYYD